MSNGQALGKWIRGKIWPGLDKALGPPEPPKPPPGQVPSYSKEEQSGGVISPTPKQTIPDVDTKEGMRQIRKMR